MSVQAAINASGSTWSAYRYHNGELIWASVRFTNGTVFFGDAIGGYPETYKYQGKFDWQPWRKGHALPAAQPAEVPDREEEG